MEPERLLWAAVLLTALDDPDADTFAATDDFATVCALAGFDADAVRDAMEHRPRRRRRRKAQRAVAS